MRQMGSEDIGNQSINIPQYSAVSNFPVGDFWVSSQRKLMSKSHFVSHSQDSVNVFSRLSFLNSHLDKQKYWPYFNLENFEARKSEWPPQLPWIFHILHCNSLCYIRSRLVQLFLVYTLEALLILLGQFNHGIFLGNKSWQLFMPQVTFNLFSQVITIINFLKYPSLLVFVSKMTTKKQVK